MDAKAKSVREILHAEVQFIVPFFQRSYSWSRTNWERLKSDIWILLEEPARLQHFLGPLVCAALKPMPGEVPSFQLIDGQQRLTTVSLLLAALRDIARDQGDEELAAQIEEYYLLHRFRKGWQQFKLMPRAGDREAFLAIVKREPYQQYAPLRMIDAYDFFRKTIRQDIYHRPTRLRELFEVIVSRLHLVVITIGEENPYEIFESLNSTGLPLEESDLIRNFIFMQLRLEDQDYFHKEHWEKYEKLFDPLGNYLAVSPTVFYRDFLMKDGQYSRQRATFLDFKQYYEQKGETPQTVTEQLARFAKLELSILRDGTGLPNEVAGILGRFPMMDAATAHPLLLNLLDRGEKGELSDEEFVGCVKDIVSFVFRRTVCGDQTGAYGKWFCEVIPQLRDKPREQLQAYLLHRGWPDDELFQSKLIEFPIYRREPKKCKLILELLEESYKHKEKPNLQSLQIEHVMPQTLASGKAGASWREMLGDQWRGNHERHLHTLGNLTLTGYNPSLGNKSYADKQTELLKSNVTLNSWFKSCDRWDADTIVSRGMALAKLISGILPRPINGPLYVPPSGLAKPKAGKERRSAYWSQLIQLLDARKSPWLPIKHDESSTLSVQLPAYDVTLTVQYISARQEIAMRLIFSRERGKKMYDSLKNDRILLDREFLKPPEWIEGDYPEIKAVLPKAFIRDSLDWLDQHEWITNQLTSFHRAFYRRLSELQQTVKEKTPHRQQLFDYWCGFHDYLRKYHSELSGVKPLPAAWNDFTIGRSGCLLEALCNTTEQRISVQLLLAGKYASSRFQELQEDAQQIEAELGAKLEWHGPVENKQKQVILRMLGVDPANREDWQSQYAWLREKLEHFYKVFQPRVQEFESPEEDGDEGQLQN